SHLLAAVFAPQSFPVNHNSITLVSIAADLRSAQNGNSPVAPTRRKEVSRCTPFDDRAPSFCSYLLLPLQHSLNSTQTEHKSSPTFRSLRTGAARVSSGLPLSRL